MGPIEQKAREILKDFEDKIDQPASLSGLYHKGESMRDHLEMTTSIMKHLCDAYNIKPEERDMLIACCLLHDIGKFPISRKGFIEGQIKEGWLYYEATGWSRIEKRMKEHPTLSAEIIEKYGIPRKEEIKRIVSRHMAHWYKNSPQPEMMYDYMLVTADYLSTRQEDLYKYVERTSEFIKKPSEG